MQPDDLVDLWIGGDVALEVDVVVFTDVGGVEVGAERQIHDGSV